MTEPQPPGTPARPRLPDEVEQKLEEMDRRTAEAYRALEEAVRKLDKED